MVLQPAGQAHAATRHEAPHPDPGRIAGISGTLAFNILLFMVLLVPMTRPGAPPLPEPKQQFDWIEPRAVPPDPPPVEVEVVKPRTPAIPERVVQRRVETPPAIEPVVVDLGTVPAEDPVQAPAVAATPTMAESGPVTGMRLEYAEATPPPYPRDAIARRIEGTVMLRVLVGVDGSPLEVSIHRSSGDRRLDAAAREHVLRRWSFQPALRDGQPVQAIGLVPIDFRLDRG